jgi:hypothetical protein
VQRGLIGARAVDDDEEFLTRFGASHRECKQEVAHRASMRLTAPSGRR